MIRMQNPLALFFCCMFLGTALPPSSAGKSEIAGEECSKEQENKNNAIKLSIFSTKNQTGDWTTSFVADQGLEMNTKRVNLALQRTLIECEGKPFLRTEGILQEFNSESRQQDLLPKNQTEILTEKQPCDCKVEETDILKFDSELKSAKLVISEDERTAHKTNSIIQKKTRLTFNEEHKGRKAVLTNEGRTAHRRRPREDGMEYASLITNRPLYEEEMFKLKLEETIQYGLDGTVAFGLTSVIPAHVKNSCHLADRENGTWANRYDHILNDGSTIKTNYGLDMRRLAVGTVIGALRKKNGDLHFYKNGVDMGLAATNLPENMYGLFDMRDYITKVSIVE